MKADNPIESSLVLSNLDMRSYVALVVSPISTLGITRQIIMSPMVLIPPAFIMIAAKTSG